MVDIVHSTVSYIVTLQLVSIAILYTIKIVEVQKLLSFAATITHPIILYILHDNTWDHWWMAAVHVSWPLHNGVAALYCLCS